jgi:hypothetical protein
MFISASASARSGPVPFVPRHFPEHVGFQVKIHPSAERSEEGKGKVMRQRTKWVTYRKCIHLCEKDAQVLIGGSTA